MFTEKYMHVTNSLIISNVSNIGFVLIRFDIQTILMSGHVIRDLSNDLFENDKTRLCRVCVVFL